MNKRKRRQLLASIAVAILGSFSVGTHSQVKTWTESLLDPMISTQVSQKKTAPIAERTNHETTQATTQNEAINQVTYQQLAALDFHSGEQAVHVVNNNNSTLNPQEWSENRVLYGDLDRLNRTTQVTAYLDKRNLGRSKGRERQVWKPTGWHQKKVEGKDIYNRGHLLAYTSSFNFDIEGHFKEGQLGSIDNPKNLATQSAFANQHVQTHYEELVRHAQAIADNRVVYQIVTVFRGTELMPRGYWLQAKDSAGTLNFNVYEYNVEPHIQFNYQDGTSRMDPHQEVIFRK